MAEEPKQDIETVMQLSEEIKALFRRVNQDKITVHDVGLVLLSYTASLYYVSNISMRVALLVFTRAWAAASQVSEARKKLEAESEQGKQAGHQDA